ncbi:MAG: NAD(P)-binding domain-containing protein [Ignavibacteriales bacterium]|nr:NAD(P)-binding domain-containing protein [Ignavibacteriales bacterium]
MYEIIIIGAGPAGISMAAESRVAGVEKENVLIIEKANEHSFSIKKYYPDKKVVTANYKGFEVVCTGTMCITDLTKTETISYLDKSIAEFDLNVHYSETVWKIHQSKGEQRFSIYTDKGAYDTKVVAIAIGILGKPNKPAYKLPITLKEKILFDITSVEIKNSKVLVVGGGDSASEYCQFLSQDDNAVYLSYRGDEFTRMNDINKKSILALKQRKLVKILYSSNIAEVTDISGKSVVKFEEKKYLSEQFDYIVYALGGTTPHNFLKMIGIEFNGEEPILKKGYETNVPGMFLIGDLSAGNKGGSIIWAFNSANTAMKHICEKYLGRSSN